jgi:hypothetical protein
VRVSTHFGRGLMAAAWLGVAAVPSASGAQDAGGSAAASPPPSATLRCWQDGKLIFERTGLQNLTAEATDRVILNAAKGDGDEMILLDSGRATCLFERDE